MNQLSNTFSIRLKEKLIIKNFGPIKNVELELGRFNILIGEQATGKSTVAKVLAVCRYFSYIISQYEGLNFREGLEAWGLSELIEYERTYISYECEHYFFEAKSETETPYSHNPVKDEWEADGKYPVWHNKLKPISDVFKKIFNEFENLRSQTQEENGYAEFFFIAPTSFFTKEVASVLDNPFYFPVERGLQSIFSLGRSSIQNISDTLFNQFAKLDQATRFFKTETAIEPLNITYKNENGQGYIKSDKHDFVKVFNAASGYQSTIPVVLTIQYYNKTKKKRKTFIIEEPELNLFPDAQQKLMKYLVEQVNVYNNSFLLTTHSPYILTPINNLLYAHQVGRDEESKTEKIIDKKYWLNPDDVSAYKMLPDGTCENIFDEEEKLIKAEKIDTVTNEVNEQFEKLLNTQLVHS